MIVVFAVDIGVIDFVAFLYRFLNVKLSEWMFNTFYYSYFYTDLHIFIWTWSLVKQSKLFKNTKYWYFTQI